MHKLETNTTLMHLLLTRAYICAFVSILGRVLLFL